MALCVSYIETRCCPRQYREMMIQLLFSNVTLLAFLSLPASSIADRLPLWVEYGQVVSARGSSLVGCFCWGKHLLGVGVTKHVKQQLLL